MKRVIEGSQSVAEAVRLARAKVISAYPITPQTHIVEFLSEYCASGTMDARFLRVESEHSALAALIGAQSCGVRTFTATSSQGLALMHELLHWASGARLPIVMAEVNRALAPGWNIWTDQTDSLAQRDTGWIQLYCEDGQEVLDSMLQAYRLAELVYLPVMVVLDAFYLSHTYEPVDVPEQEDVDRFLPPYQPQFQIDTENPCSFGQLVQPGAYMKMRQNIATAMETALERLSEIQDEFYGIFGRRYSHVEAIGCDDAEIIFVTSGTATSTCRLVQRALRDKGEKVGILKMKSLRPFPVAIVREATARAKKIAVIDRNFSFGASGIFAQELRAALFNAPERPAIFGYIAGIGGLDITTELLDEIYWKTKQAAFPEKESVWMGV
ncbi:MAG TPA: pyruvate ferredoxin oxidoreductase [Syntrophales bacterium]|nr:pyruvate ferredoxin oxidoreductase [Syntrophales bacterium]